MIRTLLVLSLLFQTNAAIRIYLSGGAHSYEGTIHIEHSGSYGTICDDNFDTADAKVVCRMLGYHGPSKAYSGAHFGQGTGPTWIDELQCTGYESDVSDCRRNSWGNEDCGHSEDAGVRCSSHDVQTIRLIGGRGNFEGTVDVMENGHWGSICDRNFTDQDATVVCRALGFTDGHAVKGAYFGQLNRGRIWTDKLGCHGNETGIWQCKYYATRWGQSNTCNDSMDAGVVCDHTAVRLVGGSLPSEGRVEVQHNGVWGTVCGNSFTQHDADVVCRMLSFNHSAVSIQYNTTRGSGPIWLGDLGCHGGEVDIQFCNLGGWNNHSCNHANDVGVTCKPTDVRLSRGSNPSEGTVEIKIDGSWKTICDPGFGDNEASVICRMLGYTGSNSPHTIYHSDYFGHSYSVGLDKVSCQGDESDISQCSSIPHTSCSTSKNVGLRCEGVQVRLVGGAHSTEGRVEVLHGGQWGSVCDSGWDDADATVVCKMLAYYPYDGNAVGKAVSGSYFGFGDGPVWLADVGCNGTENDLTECSMSWRGGVNCDHGRDAGVVCEFAEEKRLQGGQTDTEGNIEFNYGGTWHSYCDDGWNKSDAIVVCRELGYWTANPILYNSSHFGRSRTTVYKVDPQCTGKEGNLEMCRMGEKLGPVTCSSSESAGVDCNPQTLDMAEIRLVDGPGPWRGRLEINKNGVWGSVCYDFWNDTYTDLVCHNLRFLNTNVTSFKTPVGLTSMHYKRFDCQQGGETNLGQCKADFNVTDCSRSKSQAVGIDCSGGLGVTLNSGGYLQGKVELHTSNTTRPWTVCRSGLNNVAAQVICTMAGYSNTSPNVTSIDSQDPILYTNIACDGWESHVSQCSTMNTGQSCDERAYIDCFNGCIRNHTGSAGTIVSRNYPAYTADMDCLDIIKNPGNTLMKLTFNDLNLSGDGDFVEISDGPHGRQLGLYASNAAVPMLATNKDFYIRLKTNNMTNARGFNVSYSRLNVEDTISMNCGPSGWEVAVNVTQLRQLFPDTGVSQIKLSDQKCTGQVLGDLVVFKQHYTQCSTTHKVNEGNIIYNNQLVYPEATEPFPIVVRGYRWTVEVECDVARTDTLANSFHPNRTVVHHNPHKTSSTHYSSEVKFFSDGTFFKEIHGNPLSLKTGEDVYVMVKMTSDDVNIKMRVDSCYTKPDPNAGPALTFPLIQNGCVVDTYTRLLSQGNHETRLVFTAFEFPQSRDAVYVYCNATYCDVTDSSNKCTQICHGTPTIVGRAIGSWGY
ncbi:deleted in malignant brain tumors 1 protein-like [Mercenaria mercenaria]|uniref:deleted in malignant brain tumors 1 protein-like n=1 Tax=Mercenaria mercenaria TaxID=6596 RepID=UPI00234FA736|nr:deleted in malignant brain tumors 1 protein-like [Mercenaria mercenaria]